MTEGISKEILYGICASEFETRDELLDCLKAQCVELDPWLPIDENTPKDRPIWLFNGVKCLAQWDDRDNAWHAVAAISNTSNSYNPELGFTHWKELPEDPL